MSESKVELNARKIRNGIRKSKERQQKKIWEKLTTTAPAPRILDPNVTYTVTRNQNKQVWYYPTKLRGEPVDKVIIDEWVEK